MSVVHDIMDPVTSALVGRDAELEHLCSTLGISASATDQPRCGGAAGGRRRSRQDPAAHRAARPGGRRGLAGARRSLPRLRRQRAALPPHLRDHRPDLPRAPRHLRRGRRAPPGAAPAPPRPADAVPGDRPRVGAGRPGRPVRRRPRPRRGRRPRGPAAARRRGPPLGRPVHPRPDELPVQPRLRRPRSPWSRPTAPTTSTAATRSAARSPSGRAWPASSASRSSRCLPPTYAVSSTSSARSRFPEERVRDIVDRAEGNAFFVEELVGASSARQGGIPEDLADVLLVRLEGLDDASVTVVRASAVAGRRVSHAALSAVVDVSSVDLDRAVRDAVEGHVLVPSRDDVLPVPPRPARRGGLRRPPARRAHRSPRGLRTSPPGGPRHGHRRRAGPPRPAGQGLRDRPHREPARGRRRPRRRWCRGGRLPLPPGARALARHPGPGGQPPRLPPSGRPRLRRPDRGRTPRPRPGRRPRAARPPAARHLRLGARPAARGARRRARHDRDPGRPDRADATGGGPRARRAHGRPGQGAGGARPHAGPGAPGRRGPRGRDGRPGHGRAARHAAPRQRHPHHPGRSRAERLARVHRRGPACRDRRQASAAGADNAEMRGLLLLGHHHLDRGEFALADEAFDEATIRGRKAGTPWNPYAAEARWSHAMSLKLQGRWDEALRVLDIERESPPPIYRALFTATRADILAARGDARAGDLARRPARVLAARGPDRDHRRHRRAGPARPGGRPGRRARDVPTDRRGPHRHLAPAVPGARPAGRHHPGRLRVRRRPPQRHRAGRGRRGRGPPRRRRPRRDRPARRRPCRVGSRGARLGGAAVGRAPALAVGGRRRPAAHDELLTAWREAVARFETYGAPYELASVRARFASLLTATGDLDEAREQAAAMAETARSLGATPLLALGRAGRPGAGRTRSAGDPDPARVRDPRPGRRGPEQRRDRPAALHQHQDRVGPRLQHPRQARRRRAHRGRCDRAAGGTARLRLVRPFRVLVVWRAGTEPP